MTLFRHSQRIATVAAALGLSATLAAPASAIDLDLGHGVTGSLDTTLSFGMGIRTESRNRDLIGFINGGNAASINGDNGNLNFDKGDLTSLNARAVHELSLNSGDISFFTRFTYFYDYINQDATLARTQLNNKAKNRAGARFDVLDLYISNKFDIGDQVLKVRVGQQVVSWGESTFIQNGINVVNPVDVTKLRTAGSELREAVLPVPIIHGSLSLTDTISIEMFYQAFWRKTNLEAEGTFFATNDFAGPGGRNVFLRFGLPPGPRDNPVGASIAPVGSIVNRARDRDGSDGGQFGVAIHALAPSLGDTEFGAYFVKYNSRLPIISGRTGTLAGLLTGDYARTAAYFLEYPDDIKLVGGSFNTTIGDVALQAEYSYHWDQPMQVDDVELLFAALSPLDPLLGLPLPPGTPVFGRNQLGRYGFNQEIPGYRRKAYSQAQFTLTDVIPNVWKFDQVTLLAEFGATWIHGMESKGLLRYEGPGTYTSANPSFTALALQPRTEASSAFATSFSWGYRLVARGEINNAIGAVSLTPTIAFNHDVNGTTPTPISNFVEDRKSVTLSLGANYLNSWQASLAYTNNFGGSRYNLLTDRDFISLSISYSF